MQRLKKYLFEKFAERIEDKQYTGHGNYVSKRFYSLRFLWWVFEMDYDTEYK